MGMFCKCLVTGLVVQERVKEIDALGTFSCATASQRQSQKPDFGSESLISEP